MLLRAGFIRIARFVEWLSNIVIVIKKDGQVRVCIGYRNLNLATPKDDYGMPAVDLLIDVAANHANLTLIDGYFRYNEFVVAREVSHSQDFVQMLWGSRHLGMAAHALWVEKCKGYIPKSYEYYLP